MIMHRIVLDTNCLLAILPSKSKYHLVWNAFLEGRFELCVSNEILEEYEEIISMKTSDSFADIVIYTLVNGENTAFITPYYHFDLIKADVDDNKFVDCAICGNASYIVSEDNHFRILSTVDFPKVEVLSLMRFMETLGNE